MWRIYKDGNAKNECGEEIRIKFTVESYTRQPLIPGFFEGVNVNNHGEFDSLEAAKKYLRELVDKLNQ